MLELIFKQTSELYGEMVQQEGGDCSTPHFISGPEFGAFGYGAPSGQRPSENKNNKEI